MKIIKFVPLLLLIIIFSCSNNTKKLFILEKSHRMTNEFIMTNNIQTRKITTLYNGKQTNTNHKIDLGNETMEIVFGNNSFKVNIDNTMSLNDTTITFKKNNATIIAIIGKEVLSGKLQNGQIKYTLGNSRILGVYKKQVKNNKTYIEKLSFSYTIDKTHFKGIIIREYEKRNPSGPSCCNYPVHIKTEYNLIIPKLLNDRHIAFLMLFVFRLLN